MTSISSLGAGTNLDLGTIYDRLEKSEMTRLKPITKAQNSYQAKLTSWGIIQTALSKVQSAAADLKNASSISTVKKDSMSSNFSVEMNSEAAKGDYSIEVKSLAKSHLLISKEAHSKTDPLSNTPDVESNIFISQGDNGPVSKIKLSKGESSLEGIKNAINKQQNKVTATVIKADEHSFRLSISANESGTSNKIKISSDNNTISDLISFDGSADKKGMTQYVAADDAVISMNGIDVRRSANTISDAIPGVTLNIKEVSGKPERLVLSRDSEPLAKAVKNFVDSYNSLQTTISSQTKFTALEKGQSSQDSGNGALVGDSTLRSLQNNLRSLISQPFKSGSVTAMGSLGVSQDVKGKLIVDSTKLEKIINDNPSDVINFLIGSDKNPGFAKSNLDILNKAMGDNGSINNVTKGINYSLKKLDERSADTIKSISNTMEQYKTQFKNLSKLISSLEDKSKFLTKEFEKLK